MRRSLPLVPVMHGGERRAVLRDEGRAAWRLQWRSTRPLLGSAGRWRGAAHSRTEGGELGGMRALLSRRRRCRRARTGCAGRCGGGGCGCGCGCGGGGGGRCGGGGAGGGGEGEGELLQELEDIVHGVGGGQLHGERLAAALLGLLVLVLAQYPLLLGLGFGLGSGFGFGFGSGSG